MVAKTLKFATLIPIVRAVGCMNGPTRQCITPAYSRYASDLLQLHVCVCVCVNRGMFVQARVQRLQVPPALPRGVGRVARALKHLLLLQVHKWTKLRLEVQGAQEADAASRLERAQPATSL